MQNSVQKVTNKHAVGTLDRVDNTLPRKKFPEREKENAQWLILLYSGYDSFFAEAVQHADIWPLLGK